MKMILVRHGETILNVHHKTQGWCDSPLTEKGIQQAKDTAEILKYINIKHAYCSSSERAIDTAEIIIKDRNIPLTIDRRLKEMNFGLFEASDEYIKAGHQMKPHDYTSVGGENLEMLLKRFSECINEITMNSDDDDIVLIVTHGGAIYRFLAYYVFKLDINKKHPQFKTENGGFKVLSYSDGKYSLEDSL